MNGRGLLKECTHREGYGGIPILMYLAPKPQPRQRGHLPNAAAGDGEDGAEVGLVVGARLGVRSGCYVRGPYHDMQGKSVCVGGKLTFVKRGCCVSNSARMQPTDQTSTAKSYSPLPSVSSGQRYHDVTTFGPCVTTYFLRNQQSTGGILMCSYVFSCVLHLCHHAPQPLVLEDRNMAGEMATWGPQRSTDMSAPSPVSPRVAAPPPSRSGALS